MVPLGVRCVRSSGGGAERPAKVRRRDRGLELLVFAYHRRNPAGGRGIGGGGRRRGGGRGHWLGGERPHRSGSCVLLERSGQQYVCRSRRGTPERGDGGGGGALEGREHRHTKVGGEGEGGVGARAALEVPVQIWGNRSRRWWMFVGRARGLLVGIKEGE